jgi:DNA (cytosine-5)-methyltransferase 1
MQGFGDYEIDSISSALKARDWKDSTDLVFSADENKIILFDGIRSGDPRVSDDELVPTVTARWGTGGNNVPMVHNPEVTPIQDARGVEKKQNGLGIGSLGDPAYTVDTVSHQAVAVHAYDEYNDSIADTHHTLRAGTKQSTGVLTASTVRRLTPLECERLQGFPDNWTLNRWDFKKSEEYKQSDSSRYKQMGNAVAVPVVQWIAERLLAFHNR